MSRVQSPIHSGASVAKHNRCVLDLNRAPPPTPPEHGGRSGLQVAAKEGPGNVDR
jgi:hypothetical protein